MRELDARFRSQALIKKGQLRRISTNHQDRLTSFPLGNITIFSTFATDLIGGKVTVTFGPGVNIPPVFRFAPY